MDFKRIKEGPGVWDFNIAHADGEGMLHQRRTAVFVTESGEELQVVLTTSTRVSKGGHAVKTAWHFKGHVRLAAEKGGWEWKPCIGFYDIKQKGTKGWIAQHETVKATGLYFLFEPGGSPFEWIPGVQVFFRAEYADAHQARHQGLGDTYYRVDFPLEKMMSAEMAEAAQLLCDLVQEQNAKSTVGVAILQLMTMGILAERRRVAQAGVRS